MPKLIFCYRETRLRTSFYFADALSSVINCYANILIVCNFDIRRSYGAKNEDLSELRDDSRRIG